MSKNVVVCCNIKQVNPVILKKAMDKMLKQLDGRLTVISDYNLSIFCGKLSGYNISVKIENQKLLITGDSLNVEHVSSIVEQYYTAMMFEDLPNCTADEMDKEDIILTVEV